MKLVDPEEFKKQKVVVPQLPEYTFYPKDLPSQGIFYPDGFYVKVRPYTFGEIEYISQSSLPFHEILKFVLGGITTEKIDSEDLTLFDFMFLAIVRRLLSFGTEEYKLLAKCPQCGKEVSKIFNLQDIEFEDMKISLYKPLKIKYRDIELTLDVVRIRKLLELKLQNQDLSPKDLLALHINSLDFEQAKEFVSNLLAGEIEEFSAIVERYFYHGAKPLKIECQCGYIIYKDLDREVDLIKPFRGPKTTPTFKILDN